MAQQGDLEAFTTLYRRHLASVYNHVRYRVPEADVEDVTQEIFISAVRSLKSFKGNAKFSTWLRTLTKRRVADYYRRKKETDIYLEDLRENQEEIFGVGSGNPGISSGTDDKIMLRRAIGKLPDHYQEIIIMRFAEGLQFGEIAETHGKTLDATKSMYRRAIAALRDELEGVKNG